MLDPGYLLIDQINFLSNYYGNDFCRKRVSKKLINFFGHPQSAKISPCE